MWRVSTSTAQVLRDSTAPATASGIDVEPIAVGHGRGDHRLDAPEQRLVLDLLVAEAHQRLERQLVAQRVLAADLEQLGGDEAFDQAEHVGVGAALDLADEAPLGFRQRQVADQREAVGEVLAFGVELAAANDVAVDVPAHRLGGFDGAGVLGGIGQSGNRVHGVVLRLVRSPVSGVPS
jgi:hypothetical protein